MALAADGDLYVVDAGNHAVRRISPSGKVHTVLGMPGLAQLETGALPGGLRAPAGLAFAPGGTLYITDAAENVLLKAVLPHAGDGGPAHVASRPHR